MTPPPHPGSPHPCCHGGQPCGQLHQPDPRGRTPSHPHLHWSQRRYGRPHHRCLPSSSSSCCLVITVGRCLCAGYVCFACAFIAAHSPNGYVDICLTYDDLITLASPARHSDIFTPALDLVRSCFRIRLDLDSLLHPSLLLPSFLSNLQTMQWKNGRQRWRSCSSWRRAAPTLWSLC